MRALLLLAVLSCWVGIGSCNKSAVKVETPGENRGAGFAADAECHAAVRALDYGDLLPAMLTMSESIRGEQSAGLSTSSGLVVDLKDPTLTLTERTILHGLHFKSRFGPPQFKDGKAIPAADTDQPQYPKEKYPNTVTMHCSLFFRSEGRLPQDGAELALFALGDRINSVDGISKFLQWPREKQADLLLDFINPVSGKLYGSFSGAEWEPGEIHFSLAGPDDWQRLVETSKRIFSDQSEPLPQSWVVQYCGEVQGRVLAEGLNAIIPETSRYHQHPLASQPAPPEVIDGVPGHDEANNGNPCNPCDSANPCNPCNPRNPCNPCGH